MTTNEKSKALALRPASKPRHIDTRDGIVTRTYRAIKLPLVVTEEQFVKLAALIAQICAYPVSITKTNEVPDVSTFKNAWLPAKLEIAKLVANQYSSIVEPSDLSGVSLTTMPYGYGTLSVRESRSVSKKEIENRSWNFILSDESGLVLYEKYLVAIKQTGRKLSQAERNELMLEVFSI
jgi:hypothetical protein